MHDHWLFVWNVLAHWVASMSSIVSFTLGIVELARNRKTEAWIFWAVAALFLMMAFDWAWQDEHRNLQVVIAERKASAVEGNFWKDQSYQKDADLRTRDGLLASNFTVLGQTQTSLTTLALKLADLNKREPQRFTIRRQDTDQTAFAKYKNRADFIVMTNISAPGRLTLVCEHAIPFLEAQIIEGGPRFPGVVQRAALNVWMINIPSPQVTPSNPLLVSIGYDDSIGKCATKQ
jgi:hypothetical protein